MPEVSLNNDRLQIVLPTSANTLLSKEDRIATLLTDQAQSLANAIVRRFAQGWLLVVTGDQLISV
jgi:hypothetical protein